MTRDEQLIKAALDMAAETAGAQMAPITGTPYAAGGRVFATAIRAIDPAEVLAGLPPAPDAVAESDDWNTIGAGAVGHLREMYRPAYDALGSSGRTSLRNWINALVDRAIKDGWPT